MWSAHDLFKGRNSRLANPDLRDFEFKRQNASVLPRNSPADMSCMCISSVALRAWGVPSTQIVLSQIKFALCCVWFVLCYVTNEKIKNDKLECKTKVRTDWKIIMGNIRRTYRIHRIFSGLFPSSCIPKNTTFRKLDLFPSSGEGGEYRTMENVQKNSVNSVQHTSSSESFQVYPSNVFVRNTNIYIYRTFGNIGHPLPQLVR
jgi:hypothetical protein